MISFVTLSKFLLIVEICCAFVHNTFVLQHRQNNIYTRIKLNRRSNDLINHNIKLEQNAKICINEIKRALRLAVKKNKEISKPENEIWYNNLIKLEDYINKYNKLPSRNDKCKINRDLSYWASNQKHYYKNNIRIMKDDEIKMIWEGFVKEYYYYL